MFLTNEFTNSSVVFKSTDPFSWYFTNTNLNVVACHIKLPFFSSYAPFTIHIRFIIGIYTKSPSIGCAVFPNAVANIILEISTSQSFCQSNPKSVNSGFDEGIVPSCITILICLTESTFIKVYSLNVKSFDVSSGFNLK